MKLKTQKILEQKSEHESLFLRITPDASQAVIAHKVTNLEESLVYVKTLDEDSALYEIPRRQKMWRWDCPTSLVDISPDGRYVAITYSQEISSELHCSETCLWDFKQKTFLMPFINTEMHYPSSVGVGNAQRGCANFDVRFLPDNDRLIIVNELGGLHVHSISQQKRLWAISPASHLINSVALSHKLAYFAMSDSLSKKWHLGFIGQHVTRIDKILRKRYGMWVDSEKLDTTPTLRLWNIYSGTLIRQFEADDVVRDLVFSPNDKLLAGEMKETALIWEVETGAVLNTLPRETHPIAFTADSRFLVTQIGTDKIGLWNVAAKNWHRDFTLEGGISAAQLSANDKLIALSKTGSEWLLHEVDLGKSP